MNQNPNAGVEPAASHAPARVALIMLVVGSSFPPWWPFLIASYKQNYPTYHLIVVHTGERVQALKSESHVRYENVPVEQLKQRFIVKLGATREQVEAKFASGKGLSDLKPLYGRVFDDLIEESRYTHWGWVDWDLILARFQSGKSFPNRAPGVVGHCPFRYTQVNG